MANNLSGQVWFIDTSGAGLIFTGMVKVKQVYWNGTLVAGNAFSISDKAGRILLAATLQSTGQQPTWAPDEWWGPGVAVTALTAGTSLQITTD